MSQKGHLIKQSLCLADQSAILRKNKMEARVSIIFPQHDPGNVSQCINTLYIQLQCATDQNITLLF